MATKSIKFFDYLCRACMHEPADAHSYADNTKQEPQWQSLSDTMEECGTLRIAELLSKTVQQIEVELSDELPQKICCECLQQLLSVYRFVQMCVHSDQQMRELINKRKTDLEMIEDKISSKQFSIQNTLSEANEFEFGSLNTLPKSPQTTAVDRVKSIDTAMEDKTNSLVDISDKVKNETTDDDETNAEYSDGETMEKNNVVRLTTEEKQVSLVSSKHICALCNKSFEQRRYLKMHLNRHKIRDEKRIQRSTKNPQKTRQYSCEFCDKSYYRSGPLKNHIRTHTGERPYLCPQCGKSFITSTGLQQHILRHSELRPFECPHCPLTFRCNSNLASHKLRHETIKRHICDVCGSAFTHAYSLRKHKKHHDSEKPHKCEFCEMRFIRIDQQRRHMRIHTGEKPYQCKYCECAYAQGNDLIKHLRTHLGDNVYRCTLCPLAYRLASELRLHFASHKYDDEEARERNMKALKEEEAELQ